jgi:protein-tyrosine-phosphatase
MERKHRERVEKLIPEAKEKTFLLKEFGDSKENLEIRDPIGLSDEVYKEVAEEIKGTLEKALPRILEYLRK